MRRPAANPMSNRHSRLSTRLQALLALVLVAGLHTGVVAQDAGSQDATDQATVLPEPDANALELAAELERRRAALEELRVELGPYDPALIEAFADLGAFLLEQALYDEAADQYREAFQLSRISSGLNSEQQLPYVDKLIQTSVGQSDWQGADNLQELRYYLKNRLYAPGDARFADAVAELGDWKLRVMRENLLRGGYRGLSYEAEELSNLYRQGIARIQAVPGYSETSLLGLYQGKSLADLEVARYLAQTPYQFFEGTVPQFVYQTVCSNVADAAGNVSRVCTNIRRENPRYRDSQQDNKRMLVNRSVRESESSIGSLNDILARYPDIPAARREEIQLQIRLLEEEFRQLDRLTRRGNLL